MAVGEDGKAGDVDLAASVTLYIGSFVDGIEAAVKNAAHMGASKGDKLGLSSFLLGKVVVGSVVSAPEVLKPILAWMLSITQLSMTPSRGEQALRRHSRPRNPGPR